MWNRRDEMEGPDAPPITSTGERKTTPPAPREFEKASSSSPQSQSQVQRTPRGTIGKSICIRGELTGNEDLTIEGKVEGKVDLADHNLTIGSTGRIEAEVSAKKVIVEGEVTGNIAAGEKVELTASGRVKGDIVAPRVVIADGAQFKGMVDMAESKSTSVRPSITDISPGGKKSESDSSSKSSDKPAAKSA
jgi:cytoskeletal protein CcmA (bactofilin family)